MARHKPLAKPCADFSECVIAWQKSHGRHHLPWQKRSDAYAIWLSEIMLQQTQVAAVIPYYQGFLQRFPDIQTLAAAPVDAVMHAWSGLGYYSRARNLHACAQRVVAEFGGCFPKSAELIETLPGIGRSTAAAIAVFAFGECAAILDGNVKRILCRAFGITGYPGAASITQQLWDLSNQLLPRKPTKARIRAYTQGLMDLGALSCKPKNPSCATCPIQSQCWAFEHQQVEQLPTPKPRTVLPQRAIAILVLRHGDQLFLEKRPALGIWGNLWSFPESALEQADQAAQRLANQHGVIASIEYIPPFRHTFTHFKLDVQPVVVTLAQRSAHRVNDAVVEKRWINIDCATEFALPTPIKKLIASLKKSA